VRKFCDRSARRGVYWIGRRRNLLTVALFSIALADAVWGSSHPVDFLGSDREGACWLPWVLTCAGVAIRIWGAGNLRKNKEVTQGGIYRMVKHPLYLGNCLIYLAFFLALGRPSLDLSLFVALLIPHYCSMVLEEERLLREYPGQFEAWRNTPRLIPNLPAFREALATDRFSWRQAYRNHAYRSLIAPLLLPAMTEALAAARTLL
jgi:protein-S-isoprenylcysteine O-methyltransferase Ste14